MPETNPQSETRYVPLSSASRTYGLSVNQLKIMARNGKLSLYRPTGAKALLVEVAELERLFAESRLATV